jgi:hypothetical protein
MGFVPCAREDPFTRKVRDVYRANVVRAPRTGIAPLDVLAVGARRRVEPRGRLATLFDGGAPDLPRPGSAEVAGLSGHRSATLDLELGVELTGTFLAAVGLPVPEAKVTASLWQGARKLSFEVRDVVERRVDIGALGAAIDGHRISRNAATEVFFGEPTAQMLVITRTLRSVRFAVHATSRGGQSFQVDVDGLAEVLGAASLDVGWSVEDDSTIAFRGKTPATFAFGAVPCALRRGATLVFGLEVSDKTFGTPGAVVPHEQPAIDDAGLLTFDEDRGD